LKTERILHEATRHEAGL